MRFVSMTANGFAVLGELKTFFRAGIRFDLRHFDFLLKFFCGTSYLAAFAARNMSMLRFSSFAGFSTVPTSEQASAKDCIIS